MMHCRDDYNITRLSSHFYWVDGGTLNSMQACMHASYIRIHIVHLVCKPESK